MPSITQHYDIHGPVPFLDVDIHVDNLFFVDPHAVRIRNGPQPFADQARTCMSSFFTSVTDAVLAPKGSSSWRDGELLLQTFGEPLETRLGMSRGGVKGHGAAEILGSAIWWSLTKDLRALLDVAILGRLEELPMFVQGIDRDITSDITTRIIYGPLADFTTDMVARYPQFHGPGHHVKSVARQVWDPLRRCWAKRVVDLPMAADEPLLLVPEGWARRWLLMSAGRYYETSVLGYAQLEQTVQTDQGILKPTKGRLKRDPNLGRGRATNAQVTLRAHDHQNNLVAKFTAFVDEKDEGNSKAA